MKKTIYKVIKVTRNSDETVKNEVHSEEVEFMDAFNIAKHLMDTQAIATKIQPEVVEFH